ncbi:MAG: tripartite tricarboxylate transporter TctB family protein [Hydrogenophaga sp.]|jgi:O-antigen ligase|uniref:tripartite tricarboxylate transporter TctB family protein n=1 Tax=Hydrogenophaga sp. TaxID=1904254 RepID=UPI0027171AAB|nr:tripartite tricarboxylate transporter TctB family protein [Hydrogenophaga sp.]MDO9481216.1 tripartite tricarboxylate transporter TctB family protein [Hydrogenophaga sp.]MDO9570858.1 tripartite tricarboxylate transporter TctB family protein [Hydrogenophaga sp.]MDP2093995.1 tripartite tricarboxylate transporter TctB family protein [Hydrogenophaga sp.]MDP2219999.1 tripartite tricarboxylate transporter TctB family protein [Hydrogenophaga sp.]MDP3343480.1 tripartite tricarboxylate transporter Tc
MKHKDMQDVLGGLGLAALGVFAAVYAQRYEFGDLNRMGAGFFPVSLGILLAVLGVMIAVPAFFRSGPAIELKWKTFALVMASVVAFALTLKVLGLVLATVLAVVVATLADNETRWKSRLMIAAGVALITYLVFGLGLGMVLPTWPWSP